MPKTSRNHQPCEHHSRYKMYLLHLHIHCIESLVQNNSGDPRSSESSFKQLVTKKRRMNVGKYLKHVRKTSILRRWPIFLMRLLIVLDPFKQLKAENARSLMLWQCQDNVMMAARQRNQLAFIRNPNSEICYFLNIYQVSKITKKLVFIEFFGLIKNTTWDHLN